MTLHTSSKCPLCSATGEFDFSSSDLMFKGTRIYSYHRCKSCKLVYQYPVPSDKEIANFYPETYVVYKQPTRNSFTPMQLSYLKQKHGYKQLSTNPFLDFAVAWYCKTNWPFSENKMPSAFAATFTFRGGCAERTSCARQSLHHNNSTMPIIWDRLNWLENTLCQRWLSSRVDARLEQRQRPLSSIGAHQRL